MAPKTWTAETDAVQKCRDMYPNDTFMQSVAAIIAMTAIDEYKRALSALRRANRPGGE